MEVSLDGRRFLERGLPFNIYDVRVNGLDPPMGSLTETTDVRIKTTGLVKTQIQEVRLDFPRDLGWPSQRIPASYDHTTGEVHFKMPELNQQVRVAIDEEKASRQARKESGTMRDASSAQDDAGDAAVDEPLGDDAPLDLDGGLAGLEVFVELSLNGQNFTEDRVHFTYHGRFEPLNVRILSAPEGVTVEKEDPKAKGGKKGEVADEPPLVHPGSKISCEVSNLVHTEFAAFRAELSTKVGEDEPQPFRTVDFPAQIEPVVPVRSTPVEEDKKGKKAEPAHTEEEQAAPMDMLVGYLPFIRTEDLPDPSAVLYMSGLSASLNGQYFAPIAEAVSWRLQPQAPEATHENDGSA
jgi:hypothetical protein